MIGHGMTGNMASAMTEQALEMRTKLQGTVIGFDKTFILQAIAFVIVIPLLLFLRVKREKAAHGPAPEAAREVAMHLE